MLTTEVLRDIYEKTGLFTTIKEFKERAGQIPLSMRYLQAIGGAMNFSMFFILIFFMVDKHVSYLPFNIELQIVNLCQTSVTVIFVNVYLYCSIHEVS